MSIFGKLFGSAASKPSITPFEAGLVLGGSLVAGHDPAALNDQEAELLDTVELLQRVYIHERLVFRASATAFAAAGVAELSKREVAQGFFQWFADFAQSSEDAALVAALFQKRLPTYLAAASEEGLMHEPSALFADNLAERSDLGEEAKPQCLLFGLAIGPAYWQAQVQGAETLLRNVGLLPR